MILERRANISIDHLIATTLSEKVSAMKTEDYLEMCAARASLEKFEAAFAKVPDTEPA